MAKYITDIIQDIIDEVDSTALNATIQEYLETPANGYMDSTATSTYYNDGTAYVPIDATTYGYITLEGYTDGQEYVLPPTLTVEQWKALYLEQTYNDAMISIEKIAFLDTNSPNYPMTDYEDILFNFDTADSLNYAITPVSDEVYLEYRYAVAQKIDGFFFQAGEDGAQVYGADSTASVILAGYISYSNNETDWVYVKNGTLNQAGDSVGIITTDEAEAKAAPFIFDFPTGFEFREIVNIRFNNISVEAKFWRFYPVDLLTYLTSIGKESGYTGYTASMSHMRYQEVKTHGSVVVTQTLPGNAIIPGGIGGDQIENASITEDKLATDSVTTDKIEDGTITEVKLADFTIGTAKIVDGAVTAAKLALNLTTIKLWSDGESVPGKTTVTLGSSFTLPNDTGWLSLAAFIHFECNAVHGSGIADFYLQMRKPNGSYLNVCTLLYVSSIKSTVEDLFGDLIRDPDTDSSRIWRIRVYNDTTDFVTCNASLRLIGVFSNNISTDY